MRSADFIAHQLAFAFCGGNFTRQELLIRATKVVGERKWLTPLVEKMLQRFEAGKHPRVRAVEQLLRTSKAFRKVASRVRISEVQLSPGSECRPAPVYTTHPLPSLTCIADLAEWLQIAPNKLAWLADEQSRERKESREPLRNYRYRWIRKRAGRARLIESPKPLLKSLQRKILHELLDHVPPHAAAHGFRAGRSILTFAQPHVGQQVVLRMDLADFFPSISRARVVGWFIALGYPETVAYCLAAICTNHTPEQVMSAYPFADQARQFQLARSLYGQPHLPQGSPTSPALANLCAYHLDARLTGLAQSANAVYTRYADDLGFSGDDSFARGAKRFLVQAAAIAMDEGFVVNFHKTQVMRPGTRQKLAGLVLNEHLNFARDEFDALRATLFNCVRYGPDSQNRTSVTNFRAHLRGRIAFMAMVNPQKAERLRTLFERIVW